MSDTPIIVDGIKVEFTIDDMDDIEVAEMLEEGRIVAAFKRIMGEDGFAELKERFKEVNGKAKTSDMAEWLNKAASKLGAEVKN